MLEKNRWQIYAHIETHFSSKFENTWTTWRGYICVIRRDDGSWPQNFDSKLFNFDVKKHGNDLSATQFQMSQYNCCRKKRPKNSIVVGSIQMRKRVNKRENQSKDSFKFVISLHESRIETISIKLFKCSFAYPFYEHILTAMNFHHSMQMRVLCESTICD